MRKPSIRAPKTKATGKPKGDQVVSRAPSTEENSQALALAATYINAIHPMTQKGIVRLSFGEAVDGTTHFHAAVVMSRAVAEMLRDSLNEVIESLDAAERNE